MDNIIEFTKMHGLGNDYIYIDKTNPKKNILRETELPKIARYLSNRNFGIGGDGIILIEKSYRANFKMRIFNSDGSEAEMCGNGIRCFGKYVYEKGLIKNENITVETLAGIKKIRIIKNKKNEIEKIEVNMGVPKIYRKKELKILDKTFNITPISMGNPHAVIFTENIEKIDLNKYGPLIENNRYFPYKTNVEFVEILDKNLIKMRVWERGSKETFACGTGACAAVVAGNINNLNKRKVKVLLKGGELEINWKEETKEIYMTGIATEVFNGRIILKI